MVLASSKTLEVATNNRTYNFRTRGTMKSYTSLILILAALLLSSCGADNKSSDSSTLVTASNCGEKDARNRRLALNKVQSRLVAEGGSSGQNISMQLSIDSAPVYELIANGDYESACEKIDEIASKYKLDLDAEIKSGLISYDQLAQDGGKGDQTCSVADASTKQMKLHTQLQDSVNKGKLTEDIFSRYNEDTKGYALLLSTNPSAACELIDELAAAYGIEN